MVGSAAFLGVATKSRCLARMIGTQHHGHTTPDLPNGRPRLMSLGKPVASDNPNNQLDLLNKATFRRATLAESGYLKARFIEQVKQGSGISNNQTNPRS